jgi:acyl-phosphate glycerol 3-phosphate acyltransferase
MSALMFALTLLGSYLVGAIPFGFLIARWRGVNIFQAGSGNIGATNVGRVLGWELGSLVFILDFAKGAVPVATAGWLARTVSESTPDSVFRMALPVGAGLAAFLGHLFPIYLRFRGGKGVATGAGVVTILLPDPTLAAVIAWVGVLCMTRYVSLASLTAAVALCGCYLLLTAEAFRGGNSILTVFTLLAVGLVFVRHRANIRRLLRRNENRLQETPTMLFLSKTIHVLAMGLWFGTAVFFLVVALVLFHTFEGLGQPGSNRLAWLPLADDFSKEQGTRLAGVAIAPLFQWYFPLQAAGAFLATTTALAWWRAGPKSGPHRFRAVILLLAAITVAIGWPLANHINDLRVARYDANPSIAEPAKEAFRNWHGMSLSLNFVTISLVTVGMAWAAQLPQVGSEQWTVGSKRKVDSGQ